MYCKLWIVREHRYHNDCMGIQVLKSLGCPHGIYIFIQKEVGRELGCGGRGPAQNKQIYNLKKLIKTICGNWQHNRICAF
jgi:hypothetical protein